MPFLLFITVAVASFAVAMYAGIRQNRKLRDSEFWPRTQGSVRSTELRQPESDHVNPQYTVVVHYSYSVEGRSYDGAWTFRFDIEAEAVAAHDWLMRCVSLEVAYDPPNPKLSVPKLPVLAPAMLPKVEPKPVRRWESTLCTFLLALAISGCAASCVINLGAWLGRTYPTWMLVPLHLGVFVVFLPAAAFVSRHLGSSKTAMTELLRQNGLNGWYSGLLTYAMINFFAALMPAFLKAHTAPSQLAMWRAFSGHWLAFYGAAGLMLHALLTRTEVSPRLSPDNQLS